MQVLPVEIEGEFMLPSDLFSKAVSSLSKDVEVQVLDNHITVKSGRFESKFNIPKLDSSKIPFSPPEDSSIEKSPEDFMASLKQVYFSVSKDETKVEMRGIQFKNSFFYSTDNYRISRFATLFSMTKEWTVPDTLLSLILSEGEPEEFCIEKDKVWFFYPSFLVFGTTFSLPFRDCEKIFNKISGLPTSSKVEYATTEVEEVLNRLVFFTNAYPYRLDVTVSSNKLLFKVKGSGAEAEEEAACKTELVGVFSVNIQLFVESLSKANAFYFTEGLVYFVSSSGLESILSCLDVR